MSLVGLRRPTHEGNVRLIVLGVVSDVTNPETSRRMGINSIFRLRRAWAAHGFFGMPGAERIRTVCVAAFDPISDQDSAEAFERGARRIAGIALEGHRIGSEADVDLFWSTVTRLGSALGIEVPPLERLRTEAREGAEDHICGRLSA